MFERQRKPAWSILYLIVTLMFVLLILDNLNLIPSFANEITDIAIVLSIFAVMVIWVGANMSALLNEDLYETEPGELKVKVFAPTQSIVKSANGDGVTDLDVTIYSNELN
jgi:hypothetical protein